eukprot:gnl/TRDRNA2_/TRDRNA2_171808_c3_seq3.p1 gnl/TRDRNA2_/TRDRNA2_171808_c3~~gnl/TRDRNA2_/TRDRNA2_171808_c3_seq3.p1  ORF type:complete len:665 (+),score=111.84 gnl/TRDRNA2_/TRDRNA2_171808_c3_seq3:36-2030(+)
MAAKSNELQVKKALVQTLSFADICVKDIQDAVASETPEWCPHSKFWTQVLLGDVSPFFKQLENQTLSFWMRFFNAWQGLKQDGSQAPETVDGTFLTDQLRLPKHHLQSLLQLMDPSGYKQIAIQGMTQKALTKVAVYPAELIIAGVTVSRLITTEHKVVVTLGLFDLEDSGFLDKEQYIEFIHHYVRAISAAFGIPLAVNSGTPRKVAGLLYDRISAHAARCIKAKYSAASAKSKEAVIQLVRQRCAQQQKAAGNMTSHGNQASGIHKEPISALMDWMIGNQSDDPLALPFRLLLMRFGPARRGGFTDEFDTPIDKTVFRLSHRQPIKIPNEGKLKNGPAFQSLSYREVLFARAVFSNLLSYCVDKRVRNPTNSYLRDSTEEAARQFGVEEPERKRFFEAFLQLTEEFSFSAPEKVTFLDLLRKLCPQAHTKHLRMFQSWCCRYDMLVEKHESLEEVLSVFDENESKPVLPEEEVIKLQSEFNRLDFRCTGRVDIHHVATKYRICPDIIDAFSGSDGYIGEREYIQMMCPEEYRPPLMTGKHRASFGKLLEFEMSRVREALRGEKSNTEQPKIRPSVTLPVVDEETWRQWNDMFDQLDANDDDHVCAEDLDVAGILSTSVSGYVLSIIDPHNPEAFTRDGFLNAMLQSHGFRRACGEAPGMQGG